MIGYIYIKFFQFFGSGTFIRHSIAWWWLLKSEKYNKIGVTKLFYCTTGLKLSVFVSFL